MITGEDDTPQRSAWLTNSLSLGAVYALGVAAWFVSREVVGGNAGVPEDDGASGEGDAKGKASMVAGLVLGYMSAVCYLCARIPQIIKNWREKSTEGMLLTPVGESCPWMMIVQLTTCRSCPPVLPTVPHRQSDLRR